MSRRAASADGASRRNQILATLKAAGRPLRTGEIAQTLGIDRKVATAALARLFHEGAIQRSKSGGQKAQSGQKERIWRLPPPK